MTHYAAIDWQDNSIVLSPTRPRLSGAVAADTPDAARECLVAALRQQSAWYVRTARKLLWLSRKVDSLEDGPGEYVPLRLVELTGQPAETPENISHENCGFVQPVG